MSGCKGGMDLNWDEAVAELKRLGQMVNLIPKEPNVLMKDDEAQYVRGSHIRTADAAVSSDSITSAGILLAGPPYAFPSQEQADKEVQGKPRWDLEFEFAFDEIIAVMTYGAGKYADRNWEKGLPWRLALGALMRHIRLFRGGETIDPESNLPHMAHAAWWCCALLDWMYSRTEFDDRPYKDEGLYIPVVDEKVGGTLAERNEEV